MIVTLIVSVGQQLQLGKDNALLWKLKDDLLHFKRTTKGHHIIMGRRTFESIGRILPHRTSIIITRQLDYHVDGALVANTLTQAIQLAKDAGENEVFLVGGESIYREGLEICDKLIISHVDYQGSADCFFPSYQHYQWQEVEQFSVARNSDNEYSFVVQTLIKKS